MDLGTRRMRFATRAEETPQSGIREVVHRALQLQEQGRDIIRLEVGESTDTTSARIIDTALRDVLAGQTRYTASAGQGELLEAIAAKLDRVNGIGADPDNIVVTVGGVQALWLALMIVCEPGDEVLIPDPGWPNYEMIATMIGSRCRRYRCGPETGFLPDPGQLRSAVAPRTRALVVNSPHNPTGAVYPPDLIRDLMLLADEHDLVLISDEAYDELYMETKPLSPGTIVPLESGRWVAAFSFSKTYAMTGWRVGYLVAPRRVAALAAKLQEPTVSCVSSVSQRAALAALSGPQDFVVTLRGDLRRRRDQVLSCLRPFGCISYTPEGAFYVLVNVHPHDDRDFALSLLELRGVSVAPGSAFGEVGKGYVRVCYAAGGSRLVEGVNRLGAHVNDVR